MSIRTGLSVLSGVALIIAFLPYIVAIVRKQACPKKATWLIWAAGDVIILSGMIAQGTISGLLVGATIGATTTFALSLRFGEAGWSRRDKVCIILSGLAIVLWLCFQDSNFGIALSLLALGIAAWPTYVSAWGNPANEDRKTWAIFNTSSFLGVLAIPHLTFADAAPPIVFWAIDLPMLFLLFARPYLQKRATKVGAMS